MSATAPDDRLAAIEAKLDDIALEVAVIRRTRIELEELKDDLSRVARDALQTAVVELEQVAPFVRQGEFVDLGKKLLRHAGTFNRLIDRLDNAVAFMEDATPLGKEVFNDTLRTLHALDQKGYFRYLPELAGMLDNVVQHFTPDDARLLAANMPAMLGTLKNLTQPEMLKAIDNAAVIFRDLDPTTIEEYSLWRVLREVNSSEMRRAMGLFFTFLKRVSAEQMSRRDTASPQPLARNPGPGDPGDGVGE